MTTVQSFGITRDREIAANRDAARHYTVIPTDRTQRTLGENVDRLGELNAQIRTLTDKADAIKAKLIASGFHVIDGRVFRATISTSERTTLDTARVRATLTPAQIVACSRTTTSPRVSLTDR